MNGGDGLYSSCDATFWPLSAVTAQCMHSEEEGKLLSKEESKIFESQRTTVLVCLFDFSRKEIPSETKTQLLEIMRFFRLSL